MWQSFIPMNIQRIRFWILKKYIIYLNTQLGCNLNICQLWKVTYLYFDLKVVHNKDGESLHTDSCPLGGHKAAPSALRGQPADPELLPHAHRHPVFLPAPPQRRPRLLQDDPHPGLHRLPAHNERPAAQHGKRHAHHRSDHRRENSKEITSNSANSP